MAWHRKETRHYLKQWWPSSSRHICPPALLRRHNGRGCVSNHQPHDCLLNRLFKAHIKENIKAPRHWPLWGKFTGDRWIPRTKDQKMFPFDDFIMNWDSLSGYCVRTKSHRHKAQTNEAIAKDNKHLSRARPLTNDHLCNVQSIYRLYCNQIIAAWELTVVFFNWRCHDILTISDRELIKEALISQ